MKQKELLFWFGVILFGDAVLSMLNGFYGLFTPCNGIDYLWIQLLRLPRLLIGGYLILKFKD